MFSPAFNGQEKDNEISGSGNSLSAEFWQYDTRLGRRWNIDPVDKEFESPYACFSDNPVMFSDPNGDDKDDKGKQPISVFFYQTDKDIEGSLKNTLEGNKDTKVFMVKNLKEAAAKLKELSADFEISNVSFVAHGGSKTPSLRFGDDNLTPEGIQKFESTFKEIGKTLYKNATICFLSCGVGRVDDNGDNKVLGNVAAWTNKNVFGAKGFVTQFAVAAGLPGDYLPFNSESRESFYDIYSKHGQYTIAIPVLGKTNYRYAIQNTGTIAFTILGPRNSPRQQLERLGRRVDSAFKASDDPNVQNQQYKTLKSNIKLFQ